MMMHKVFLFILLLLLIAFSTSAKADYATSLSFNGYILGSSGPIDVGDYSVPLVYDWNSDGRKDLIIGSKTIAPSPYNGYVKYYENTGTDSSPVFGSSSNIQSCTLTCSSIDATASG